MDTSSILFGILVFVAVMATLTGVVLLFEIRNLKKYFFEFMQEKEKEENYIKNDTERLMKIFDERQNLLTLILEKKNVREKLERLLEREIELEEYLLSLEKKTTPSKKDLTFDSLTEKKLKIPWKEWVGKIFEKVNSILSSLIPVGKG